MGTAGCHLCRAWYRRRSPIVACPLRRCGTSLARRLLQLVVPHISPPLALHGNTVVPQLTYRGADIPEWLGASQNIHGGVFFAISQEVTDALEPWAVLDLGEVEAGALGQVEGHLLHQCTCTVSVDRSHFLKVASLHMPLLSV